MSVPTYDQFIEPILRFLAVHTDGASTKEAQDAAADQLGLSESQRFELIASGQAMFRNRANWAHDRLKRAGLSGSAKRGYWVLTKEGFDYAAKHSAPLSPEEVEHLAVGFMDVKLKASGDGAFLDQEVVETPSQEASTASPDDRLEQALKELRGSIASDLLERLKQTSPSRFEVIVLDVLHRLGYGASRDDLQRVGGSGDGGIDGIISLDKLGLEKVYVQAKRWQASVGRPELQAFYGALAGQKAKRGVFITTSGYTPQATEFAKSVEGIVLVDGVRLVYLMMDNEVGVSSRVLRVPKVDGDYFDEES